MKRRTQRTEQKRQAKVARMTQGDRAGTSKYALKHRQALRGNFRPTSPFYTPTPTEGGDGTHFVLCPQS